VDKHPENIIEEVFNIDNPLTETGDKKDYTDNAWRRFIIRLPINDCGVYVLYDNEDIVYVGYSKKLYRRIRQQCSNKKIEWTTYKKYVIGNREQSLLIEKYLIGLYEPKYNIEYNPNNNRGWTR